MLDVAITIGLGVSVAIVFAAVCCQRKMSDPLDEDDDAVDLGVFVEPTVPEERKRTAATEPTASPTTNDAVDLGVAEPTVPEERELTAALEPNIEQPTASPTTPPPEQKIRRRKLVTAV